MRILPPTRTPAMNFRSLLFTVGFALVMGSAPTSLPAQVSPLTPPQTPESRVAITLVLTDHGAGPTLLRRTGNEDRNVILLDSATVDAQQLSDAVFQLLILEAQDPQGQRRGNNAAQRVRISEPHPVYWWAAEALQRLRASDPLRIRGVGGGRESRTLRIWMPPLRGLSR
ncbi:hypothetical protein [Longimicrobium sp.]|uniref:hypothetical protein n=1 Tax=Longimicrobium sp. TaxID=2029185 RepID=UPI002E33DD21|nr:hypothetical protein [Longimicrobium sp.]HEX6042823.1 hypothetical protein [Longimicrobium sp.]